MFEGTVSCNGLYTYSNVIWTYPIKFNTKFSVMAHITWDTRFALGRIDNDKASVVPGTNIGNSVTLPQGRWSDFICIGI